MRSTLFDNDAAAVAAPHAKGRKVICYENVGAWEDGRPQPCPVAQSLNFNGILNRRGLDAWLQTCPWPAA
jgi:hypothetical protein